MDTGPAMTTSNNQIVMATYADNNTGYLNYPAIIEDTYGSGRVILSGPHPRDEPTKPTTFNQHVTNGHLKKL
jgi:glutamine amidotransferase-like uncharacterized protein